MTRDLGLYIHWPFCISKCPYCDFNSHVRASIDEDAWEKALLIEMDHMAKLTKGRTLSTVFFGGGTPSLMRPKTVAALLDRLSAHWHLTPDLEITLEANPGTVDKERFQEFKDAGVTRLSMGIQSLHDDALAFLGRKHSAEEALAALKLAGTLFERFSFDLIYARPEQSLSAWREELSRALTLAGGHLSLYQLTMEKGTSFYTRHQRGEFTLPDEDLGAALYEATEELTGKAGYASYEVSNYARPGHACRHNLIYWRSHDFMGIGPGAHGRVTAPEGRLEMRVTKAPETWLARVHTHGHGLDEEVLLSPDQSFEEALLMGLRLLEGVSLETLKDTSRESFEALLKSPKLETLIAEGLLLPPTQTHLMATPEGRIKLNGLLAYLID